MAARRGSIVLMGSGEFTATMVEVHKEILRGLGDDARAVFLDTPAGFQPNADQISDKATEYFRERVQHALTIASLKAADAPADTVRAALNTLRESDFVLIGPGSPTYAVRQWRETAVADILVHRIERGGCLVAASAAALTVGHATLPVYEIYKVGEGLHWEDGLNILGAFGVPAVVVPHWNNAEGGTHDTRFCFMGEQRFTRLESLLSSDLSIVGLDEHTACIISLETGLCSVRGIGRVVVRRASVETAFVKGETFPLDFVREGVGERTAASAQAEPGDTAPENEQTSFWDRVRGLEGDFEKAIELHEPHGAARALLDVDHAVWQASQGLADREVVSQAREVLREMIVLLGTRMAALPASAESCLAPLVARLLALRRRYRDAGHWAEADTLRDAMQEAGITIEDTPDGARWRLAEPAGGRGCA